MPKQEGLEQEVMRLRKVEQKRLAFWPNFLSGIASGFGFFIGSAILVGVAIYFFSFFNTVPIVGNYVKNIINYVESQKK